MWEAIIKASILALYLCIVASSSSALEEAPESRNAKHFSLFSVVTFKNDECTSESTLTGGARQGTCYSTSECSDKKGMASGNCASGFGVCCVFLNTAQATATISENRTYLRNKNYPSVTTATAALSIIYTIDKMSADICQIRLDFVAFTIGGPVNSLENSVSNTATTNCQNDNLVIAATSGKTIGTICGAMKGEHLYVQLSPTSTDKATLTLNTVISTTVLPATAKRIWDIKTSQIPCYANYRAPNGCDRYITTDIGKITSFNFYKVSGSTPAAQTTSAGQNTGIELMVQNLNTCIRRTKGMCCVEYQVCAADTQGIALTDTTGVGASENIGVEGIFNEGWSIDIDTNPFVEDAVTVNMGMFDSLCSGDYVEIPSSFAGTCGGGSGSAANSIYTRYCGARLGATLAAGTIQSTMTSQPVCDCSEPFWVRHVTDNANDRGGSISQNTNNLNTAVAPRGFCLDYRQTPCWNR